MKQVAQSDIMALFLSLFLFKYVIMAALLRLHEI